MSDETVLHDRFRFLMHAGDALSSSLDYETTLQTVARLCVPVLADWCAVDLVTEDGALERLVVAHVDPERERLGWELHRRYPPTPDSPSGVLAVIRSGKAELYEQITDELLRQGARDAEHLEILRELGLASALVVPLTARERTFGALTLVATESKRRFGAAELELAQQLADRAALAVDNARLLRAEARARKDAEQAADRAARLLQVTSLLAGNLAPAELAAMIVDHGLGAMGARAGSLMLLTADGRELEMLEYRGYTEELVRPYQRFPVDGPLPVSEAVRDGQAIFLQSRADWASRYPAILEATRQTNSGALVALPLRATDRTIGVMGLSFAEERTFTAEDRAFMLTLAGQCAQALERARAVAALQRSERQFRGVVEASMLGIGFWTGGRITEANDALFRLVGYTREDVAAGGIVSDVLTPPEYRPADARALEECLASESGTCTPYEKEFLRKDGTRVPVLVGGTLVEREPPMGVFFVLDLTDRHRAEAQLQAAQRMEAVGRLAGGVAHEINNALQGVLGFASFVLRELTPGTPVAKDVEEIRKAATRAADITQQLLAFSRRQVRRPSDVDLSRVVAEFAPMMQQALGPERELALRLPDESALVHADRGQLEQVLLNLTLNARDAMPAAGRLTVSLGRLDGVVRLEVTDTGSGIEPDVRERIFEPFFTTKPPGEGTGLGLSVVHGIVHQSGGRIAVDSQPGRGALFRIELPSVHVAPTAQPAEAGAEPGPGGRETVLVVDDDAGVLQLVARTLRAAGYRVLEAGDGAQALEVIRRSPGVALVVSDLLMPVLGGRPLGERLAREHPGIRIVYMSGHPSAVPASVEGTDARATPLHKPFHPDALLTAVRAALDGVSA